MRICGIFAVAVLALPLLVRLFILTGASPAGLADVVEFIYDDGYYYLGIAANLAETGRSTLDGISATNGYQPLWLLCLAALAKLVGTNTWTFFVASCALIYGLAVAAPVAAILSSRKASWQPAALCITVGFCIVMIQQPNVFLLGLEPILFAPILLPLIVLIERDAGPRDWLWLSILLALGFLVRLDALSLYFSTILVLGFAPRRPEPTRPVQLLTRLLLVGLRLSIVVLPTVAVYLLVNQYCFGSAVPVSGLAKLIGGPKFSNWGVAWTFFDHWRSLGLVLAILLPLEWIARRVAKPSPLFYRSLVIVGLSMLVQCVYYCALSAWNIWPWYAYLVAIEMALIVARIVYLAALLVELPKRRLFGVASMALIAAWACSRSIDFVRHSMPAHGHSSELTFNQESLRMLASFFPPSNRKMLVAMGDRAGGLAYWGRDRLSVVQTEGLTMDMEYIRARRANRAAEDLERRFPIDYLIVDREYIPQVAAANGDQDYVIADPIQGRVTLGAVGVFCFPPGAVRYRESYPAVWGTNLRLALAFAGRIPCSEPALALIRSVERGQGLRQFSLPTEYIPGAGEMNKPREDRDRALARRLSPSTSDPD